MGQVGRVGRVDRSARQISFNTHAPSWDCFRSLNSHNNPRRLLLGPRRVGDIRGGGHAGDGGACAFHEASRALELAVQPWTQVPLLEVSCRIPAFDTASLGRAVHRLTPPRSAPGHCRCTRADAERS